MTQSKEDWVIEAFAKPYRRHRMVVQVGQVFTVTFGLVLVFAQLGTPESEAFRAVLSSIKIPLVILYLALGGVLTLAQLVKCPNCEYAMIHVRFYCKNCGVRLRPYRWDPSHSDH